MMQAESICFDRKSQGRRAFATRTSQDPFAALWSLRFRFISYLGSSWRCSGAEGQWNLQGDHSWRTGRRSGRPRRTDSGL